MDDYKLVNTAYGHVFEKNLIDEMIEVGKILEFKEGDIIINYQQYIKSIPLLLSGAIKVMREDQDSGELLLYYLEKGDTCAMSMTCCLGEKRSEIRAIGELPGTILMIPVQKMSEWISKYNSWLAFVFNSYNDRFNELLNAVDTLAFMGMKDRLINYLLERSKVENTKIINRTHQDIARELNTSRVVISRLLKSLEMEGQIKLNRNSIVIFF